MKVTFPFCNRSWLQIKLTLPLLQYHLVFVSNNTNFFFTCCGFLPYKQKHNCYSFSPFNTAQQVIFQAITMLCNTHVYNSSSGPLTQIVNYQTLWNRRDMVLSSTKKFFCKRCQQDVLWKLFLVLKKKTLSKQNITFVLGQDKTRQTAEFIFTHHTEVCRLLYNKSQRTGTFLSSEFTW
jgi:hypothetical protein